MSGRTRRWQHPSVINDDVGAGNRSAEFREICHAVTLGIPVEDYGAWRRQNVNACRDEDDSIQAAQAAAAPIALNFLDDLRVSPSEQASSTRDSRNDNAATDNNKSDPWLDNALRLEESIAQMSAVLLRQEAQYVDLFGSIRNLHHVGGGGGGGGDNGGDGIAMADAERNALDAAVASFSVRTGNQIETLRKALQDNDAGDGSNVSAHRVGIVSCLVSSLRTNVVDRMGRMHTVRMRQSLDLARDPLRCRLPARHGRGGGSAAGGGADIGSAFDDDVDDDNVDGAGFEGLLRNVYAAVASSPTSMELPSWKEAERAEEEEFNAAYGKAGEEALLAELASPPPSFPRADEPSPDYDTVAGGAEANEDGFAQEDVSPQRRPADRKRPKIVSGSSLPMTQRTPASAPLAAVPVDQTVQTYYGETSEEQEAYIEDLQRESAVLAASLQSELEDVHKIENKMMKITGVRNMCLNYRTGLQCLVNCSIYHVNISHIYIHDCHVYCHLFPSITPLASTTIR